MRQLSSGKVSREAHLGSPNYVDRCVRSPRYAATSGGLATTLALGALPAYARSHCFGMRSSVGKTVSAIFVLPTLDL